MTTTAPASSVAPATSRDQRRPRSDRRDVFELRKQFPPRVNPVSWEATEASRGRVLARVLTTPFTADNAEYQAEVRRGVRTVLDWLATMPGSTLQARWTASGAEHAADWRILAVTPLAAGRTETAVSNLKSRFSRGLSVLICADVIRPSLGWLLATPSPKNLATALARSRDPQGFAVLNDQCQRLAVGDWARGIALARIAMIMAGKGGRAIDITAGDCIQMVQLAAEATKASGRDRGYRSAFFYQLVRSLGRFPDNAPASTRAFHVHGQRSVEEMIDRYGIQCRPIRDLLVDYLRELQAGSDYATVLQLSYVLGKLFWRDLELHHPGIASLGLHHEVAAAWKLRMQVKTTTTVEGGELVERHTPRLSAIQHLGNVRTFYLDIAQWAADDPARWGPWVAVCPIRGGELTSGRAKTAAARKSRMDQRTRERLPVLPTLVTAAENRRQRATQALAAVLATEPGREITIDGQALRRAEHSPESGTHLWAEDPATCSRRDLKAEERRAFWAWASIEVLRLTGIRIEELTELSHHSLIQYRHATTGELIPLLQITPSKTDAERLLVISPELADVLATIVTRIRQPDGGIPLVSAYDYHERIWNPPMPLLFQWHWRLEDRPLSPNMIRQLINDTLASTELTGASGAPLRVTPHDFRRLFITDAEMSDVAADASFSGRRERFLAGA
ncbi:site-specific integrase [Mycobacterium paragordonae]|uniref:site-specific integrase n=1 Tax=Mycobacterium TaxID=1763 RepID=UPI00105EB9AE|nr:site-specific integrase [Mycobacterium paragordonae]TDK88396.1 site-specific integrase [Mycobacterium paragordonae]